MSWCRMNVRYGMNVRYANDVEKYTQKIVKINICKNLPYGRFFFFSGIK